MWASKPTGLRACRVSLRVLGFRCRGLVGSTICNDGTDPDPVPRHGSWSRLCSF